jgi:hypothetical protein
MTKLFKYIIFVILLFFSGCLSYNNYIKNKSENAFVYFYGVVGERIVEDYFIYNTNNKEILDEIMNFSSTNIVNRVYNGHIDIYCINNNKLIKLYFNTNNNQIKFEYNGKIYYKTMSNKICIFLKDIIAQNIPEKNRL